LNSQLATQAIAAAPTTFLPQYEFIDSKTLAERWCLSESWVREQVRSRSTDPLPHIRFGKYVRFRWGSPELNLWAERRLIGSNSKKTVRDRGKAAIQ
jgi:hypothetical protein